MIDSKANASLGNFSMIDSERLSDSAVTHPQPSPMLGKTLRKRYKILKRLGRGQFCDTYLATDEDLPGKPLCIVKQLKPKHRDPRFRYAAERLFNTEAAALYALGNHEQIPQLFAQFQENQEFYLVQEFIQGDDLSHEIGSEKCWSEEEVIVFLQDILAILAFVHQQNIIHRDVKPSNIVRRSQDRQIVLIDFGLAQRLQPELGNSQKQTNFVFGVGTQGYMPTEQAHRNPQFNSDIYAVGVMAIQALTGALPGLKNNKTQELIWRDKVKVSPNLADVLDKMVRYDFHQRYQSATEVLEALDRLHAPSPRFLPDRSSRKITIAALGVASIAFVITLIAVTQWSNIVNINQAANSSLLGARNSPPLVYENTNENITIEYPQSWDRQDIDNPLTGEIALFLASNQSDSTIIQETLSIRVEDLSPQPMSLEEYTNSSLEEIKSFTSENNIVDIAGATLANRPAQQVVYTTTDAESRVISNLEIWALKNNKAYIIHYKAGSDRFNQNRGLAEKIIRTFQVL